MSVADWSRVLNSFYLTSGMGGGSNPVADEICYSLSFRKLFSRKRLEQFSNQNTMTVFIAHLVIILKALGKKIVPNVPLFLCIFL